MEHFISFSCAVFLAFIMRACSYHMVVTGSLFVCLGRVVAPVLYLFFTQAALAQSSSAVDPKYAEAIQSYKKSDYSVALERLAQIIESDSGSVRATQRTIDIYRELDHLDSAMDYFTSIVAQFDSNQLANLGLGLVLIELGRVTEAVAPLTLAVEIDPREVSPWMALARAYRSNDDTAAVIQAFEALGALCPECPGSHLGLALLHRRWWRMESSLRYLDSALTLDPGLLDAFNQKASISFAMGQLDDGLNLSKEGLSLAKARGDLFYESKFLGQVGAAYYYMGNLKEALTYWEGAAELSGQLAEKRDELGWLENIGVVHRELGNLTLALHYLTRVLQTVRELKDRSGEGHTLSNIGGVYVELGEYEKALACHEKALEIVRAENDRKGEAIDLGNIGLIYGYMGDYEKALEYGELALTIDRELGLTRDVSSDLGNIGVTYYEQGDYARALNLFHEALAAANKAGDMSLVAVWTQALSGTYYDLSDLSNALKYNTAALELFSETGERIATAECLGMRGLLKVESKEFDDGLESFQQALTVFSESGARRQEATAHVNIAAVHYQTGELDSAVVALTTALHINNEIGYSFGAAEAHNYLGLVYRIQDRLHEAIDSHEQALRLGEQISALKHVWQAQYGLGMVFEKQGDHRKALTHYCAAINTIEDIRGGLLPEEQKLTFFGSKDEIFEKIQDLMYEMWQQNPTVELVEESYTYSEKAKARTLLDLIAESRIDIRMGVDTALLRQEKRTLSKISKLQTNLSTEDPSSASLEEVVPVCWTVWRLC